MFFYFISIALSADSGASAVTVCIGAAAAAVVVSFLLWMMMRHLRTIAHPCPHSVRRIHGFGTHSLT